MRRFKSIKPNLGCRDKVRHSCYFIIIFFFCNVKYSIQMSPGERRNRTVNNRFSFVEINLDCCEKLTFSFTKKRLEGPKSPRSPLSKCSACQIR